MNDGAEFNDPKAWAFCSVCAFIVAANPETGRMYKHDRPFGDYNRLECRGWRTKPRARPWPVETRPLTEAKLSIRVARAK